jgi:hypothetical protein
MKTIAAVLKGELEYRVLLHESVRDNGKDDQY